MHNPNLDIFIGCYIELNSKTWNIIDVDGRAVLISREVGTDHQCRIVDAGMCLASLVIDEDIELDVKAVATSL